MLVMLGLLIALWGWGYRWKRRYRHLTAQYQTIIDEAHATSVFGTGPSLYEIQYRQDRARKTIKVPGKNEGEALSRATQSGMRYDEIFYIRRAS